MMSRRRPPVPAPALLLVAAAAGAALLIHPAAATVPLDPNIPNEQALIDAGLSGVPDPRQPTSPIAVDRVLLDSVATYVQYHIAGPHAAQGDPTPTLSDDQGVQVTGDTSSGISSTADWLLPFSVPAWLPWRPPTVRRGYIILPPLPPTARAAILQFGAPGAPGAPGGPVGPGAGETIRVPLGPRVAVLLRVAHPRVMARAAGLTLALQDLGVAHLTYAYTLRGPAPYSVAVMRRSPSFAPSDPTDPLLTADGHAVPAFAPVTNCATDSLGLRCVTTIVFPPQRPGARLILTIPALQTGFLFVHPARHPLSGPWRLPAIVP